MSGVRIRYVAVVDEMPAGREPGEFLDCTRITLFGTSYFNSICMVVPMIKTAEMTKRAPRSQGPKLSRLVRVFPSYERHVLSGGPIAVGRGPDESIVVDDPAVSGHHAVLDYVSEYGVWRITNKSSNGTFVNGICLRVSADEAPTDSFLQSGAVIRMGDSLFVFSELAIPTKAVGAAVEEEEVRGVSVSRAYANYRAKSLAHTKDAVLITGPTGAGKESLARALHQPETPLVDLNCGCFTRDLIGSELFGHVRGAFTGALSDRSGAFVRASGGTLFLDEIGELPVEQQASFLRVLQEGTVRPVGSDDNTRVSARVVAATSRDLEAMEASGAFRGDLLARLSMQRIHLPGLAERRDEILEILGELLVDRSQPKPPPFTVDAAEALVSYAWPHNVRELMRVASDIRPYIDRIDAIELAMLPEAVRDALRVNDDESSMRRKPSRKRLEELLRKHNGVVAKAARALDEHETQLRRWLKAEGLDPSSFRR